MKLKQMEYLVAAVECKSLNKAAESLYTSQPNISKVLRSLEDELCVQILERTSKGVYLTAFGEQLYTYAKNMLKTASIIEEMAANTGYEDLKIASYPSNMISHKLAHYYKETGETPVHIEFLSGSSEEVVDYVWSYQSNIGLVYFPIHQEHAFNRILQRKQLRYKSIKTCDICLYVGENHPFYERDSIDYAELEKQKFVQSKSDYFSIFDNMHYMSKQKINQSQMKHVVHTNSDHVTMNMLKHTDLASVGLDLMDNKYQDEGIKRISINGSESCLSVGYVTRNQYKLNMRERLFLQQIEEMFMEGYNKML